MPKYMTLIVLALAASTVSPALSAPIRVTREQALRHPELVSEKRGLLGIGAKIFEKIFGKSSSKVASVGAENVGEKAASQVATAGAEKVGEKATSQIATAGAEKIGEKATGKVAAEGAEKVGEEAAAKASKTWGQRLKSLALNTAVGGVAAVAGTDIYESMNHNSMALGDPPPPSPDASVPTDSATTSPDSTTSLDSTSSLHSTTPGTPYYTPTNPESSTTPGYPPTNPGPGYPTSSGTTGAPSSRAIAERAGKEHALDHGLPENIFTRSNSKLNSRTSTHKNLLIRADLEKAIRLFSRMLDELD